MNDAIIEEHNSRRVFKDTDIYVIGDFAMNGSLMELRKCFEKMSGSKHLTAGHRNSRDVFALKWSTVRASKDPTSTASSLMSFMPMATSRRRRTS
ncbi:hypothetical protein JJB09_20150 [Rhizobium sp. KVB221]|uniref:Uncharacterized protein n=1 Tax=Rhizobium setariae TaxID=2801340 RepID=A0A936YT37_9HYPH|nr:hypothetical protein [Rhizobium setariae]MBL0374336.1 hypothetical protein [Rhizobium setariae]